MIENARKLNPDLTFRVGNMMDLDLEDETLAGIAAFYSIVNIPQESLPLVLREMARVLQPNGRLFLAFHMGDGVTGKMNCGATRSQWTFSFFSRRKPDAKTGVQFAIQRQINPDRLSLEGWLDNQLRKVKAASVERVSMTIGGNPQCAFNWEMPTKS
jgi:ubiquinone/menaquinone biosynthesis C-methylase UbiE